MQLAIQRADKPPSPTTNQTPFQGGFGNGSAPPLPLLVVMALVDRAVPATMENTATQTERLPPDPPECSSGVEPTAAPLENAAFANQRAVMIPRRVLSNALANRTRNGVLPTAVGHYVEAKGHYCQRSLGAPYDVVIYATGGHGWCRIAGRELAISPGELLVLPAGIPHAYGADERCPWSIYWFYAEGALTGDYLASLGVSEGLPRISVGHDLRLIALFVELIDTLEEGHDPEQLLYGASIVAHLLSVIVRCQRLAKSLVPDAAQRVSASIEFMQRNLTHTLDIAQLSRMARLSPSYYSALFKRQTGRPPLDYFLQLRMQLAADLLDRTSQSVKAIAARLGFRDALYFCRAFTGMHGMSPTEYRRRQRPLLPI